jgi:hypothetical protein
MPVIIGAIVYDKEHSLREVMKMMGLKRRVYWGVTYLFNYLVYAVITTVTIIVAISLDFAVFKQNSFMLLLIFFSVWGHTLLAFSMFLSVFFTKTSQSTIVG